MDQKTESLKHADPWPTIPLLKKRITLHISVKPSCPSFEVALQQQIIKCKQVSCRLWKNRTQRQIFQNTRQQEMLYLSGVTGIKETRKNADRNRTQLTFYSEIIKQKNRNGSIHFPYNRFKQKDHKIYPYKTEKIFGISFKKGKSRHKPACCRKGGREYSTCVGQGRQMMGMTRKQYWKRRMKPGRVTRRGYLSDSDG